MKGYNVWRNFLELRQGEVPRIHLLSTWVNKAPASVPGSIEWHYAHGVRRRRTRLSCQTKVLMRAELKSTGICDIKLSPFRERKSAFPNRPPKPLLGAS